MSSSYIEATVCSIPGGYAFYSTFPIPKLIDRMIVRSADLVISYRAFHEGDCKLQETREIAVRDGALAGAAPAPFVMPDHAGEWGEHPGFIEFDIRSANGEAVFASKRALPFYSVYHAADKKAFLVDNNYKFGSPPVIDQIAKFGQYVDGHPLIHVRRDLDTTTSLVMINPYKRAVLAQIHTPDMPKWPRVRIPPVSARFVRFQDLIDAEVNEWYGPIQLSANNRLLTYVITHSIADPSLITSHEHMDPYRADPTHMPAFQILRNRIGDAIKRRSRA